MPDQDTLGSREVHPKFGRVHKESVFAVNSKHDGHVNRNIRLAIALIDMSKPHIEIVNITNSSSVGGVD
jgi:hypothetical protein